jgi:NTE family protein
LTRYRLAGLPPDLLIEVLVDVCGTLDFHRAEEMIELGRQGTRGALTRSGLTN